MNILYLHGFCSSSNSETVNYLINNVSTKHKVFSIDIPYKPELAIKYIKEKIKELSIDIIIGTSLGGVYAYNFELPRICINPGFQFNLIPGNYKFFNSRIDNIMEFEIIPEDIDYLHNLVESYKTKLPIDPLFFTSYILIGLNDTLVSFDKLYEYTNKYDEIIYDNFEHRLTSNIIDKHIFYLIDKLSSSINSINKQYISE